jgi:ABC-type sugar transport system substrate-binding protein
MKSKSKLVSALALAIGLSSGGSAFATGRTFAVIPVGMDSFGNAVGRGFTKAVEAAGDKAIVINTKWSIEKRAIASTT